ncbi:MAG: helix-turn-helix domain-containing protein [Planctomycetes bacterium]|nr:helix-turn-helix domain-containing protein [Planctomycetota bacterium]
MPPRSLLSALGRRVRKLRDDRGWSRRELATRAKLSERFLGQVELGDGNPSVLSLEQIARALETSVSALLAPPEQEKSIALLGLRGAGKSAVGRRLAKRLGLPFVELDGLVEERAGLRLREIFELHGEDYYRRVEAEALFDLLGRGERVVLATSGGIVTNRSAFDRLKRDTTTIWLKATPEDHWNRVVEQGDHRPMANDPLAKERLRQLLSSREPDYATSDHTMDTSAQPLPDVVDGLAQRLT